MRWALPLALVALALALRLVRLAAQSFWYDEGWTSWAINQSWRGMMDLLARDNHPPLYFVLLRPWAAVLGHGDAALRAFSILPDLGTVALLYALGRRLWSTGVGAVAALLAAISPPLVMYAQEARMYSLVAGLVVAATYCLAGMSTAAATTRRRWALLYALCMAGALYSHHDAWLAFGAQGAILLILAARRRDRLPLVAGALVVVLYLPLLPLTLHQIGVARGMGYKPHIPPLLMLEDLWLFLNLGTAVAGQAPNPLTQGGVALAAAGLALGWRLGKGRLGLLVLGMALPILAACAVQSRMAFYTDRYLLFLAPFYALLMALGAWALAAPLAGRARWLGALALALLVALPAAPMGYALLRYYRGQGPLKADFRAVAAHLEEAARPGDALVLVGTGPPLLQYYHGGLAWQCLPEISVEDYVSDEQEIVRKLKAIAKPGATIWWVGCGWDIVDPQGLVEAQLRAHCTFWDERGWQASPAQTPIRVAAYVVRDTDFAPLPRTAIGAGFGPVRLTAYGLQRDSKHRLHVALWWHTLTCPEIDYNVFVHLIDAEGNILAQGDRVPLNPYYSIRDWRPGQVWFDNHTLRLPDGADVGGLRLRIGLSRGAKGLEQLRVVDGPWRGQSYIIVPASGGG